MKSPIILVPILVLAVAGCGRTVVKESKETVVEKPVVSREVIIEKPTVSREVVVERSTPAARTCTYGSTNYSHGSLSCQGGYQFRCSDGTWEGRSQSC